MKSKNIHFALGWNSSHVTPVFINLGKYFTCDSALNIHKFQLLLFYSELNKVCGSYAWILKWVKKLKKLYDPFLWMGFNCLRATATSRRQFTFYHSFPRNSWFSFYWPRKDGRLSWPWSHPVVLNTGLLEWRFWYLILTCNFPPEFLLTTLCCPISVKAAYFHQKKLVT